MTQLTPEQIADGWKPHDGGPCPVKLDSRPGVLFRDGELFAAGEYSASAWIFADHKQNLWGRGKKDGPADIIAYKEQSNG